MASDRTTPDTVDGTNLAAPSGMHALVHAHDWSATPLGPMDGWSPRLQAAVELILSNSFAMVVLWGPELIQIYNDGYRQIIGEKHPAALGQPTRECWPEVWHINQPIYQRVLRGESVTCHDALYPLALHGAIEDVWLDLCYSPLRDEAGTVAGVLVTMMDVTARHAIKAERQRSERMTARLAAIVESSDDAIISKDLDGTIQTWNAGAQRIFGYTAEEAVGRPITILMPPDHVDEEPGILARIRRGESVDHYETVRQRKDGSLLDISLSVSPIIDSHGKVVAASKIARDITQRKRIEAALRERERQLQNAVRAKDEFFAMLSHELRNPLAPIATTLQLMKLRAPDLLQREREIIEAQVQHLTALVDDLLDVARIVGGKVELAFAPVQIGAVVEAAIEATQPLLEERRQVLRTDLADGLTVSGDKRRLVQVVVNLLTNAAKYSPPGRTIHLSAAGEGGQMVLRVRDEGQGIEPELLPQVFELFTQSAQSIDRSRGGLGLGLAIVRNLIELHGGSVEAQSEGQGKGSVFTVRLPLLERQAGRGEPGADAAAAEMHPTDTRASGTRVLIVDDHALAAESLASLLEAMGYRTHVAYDGAEALKSIAEFEPHVALVDIGLPVMDGYEVARAVRGTPGRSDLPLVALTGYGQASDHARVMEAGFNEHLVKPLKAARIGELIESLVGA